jgi:hypothetical protein
MLEVSAAMAEADDGTAWVLTLVNVCNWLVGLFPQRAQDDVFGTDPGTLVSGVLAPTSTTVKADVSALQRIWRDSATAARHAVVSRRSATRSTARRCSAPKTTSPR